MGPRSNERGNTANALSPLEGITLQWGHVQMNVEIAVFCVKNAHNYLASMGPRSNERGNTTQGRRNHVFFAGFNGATFK